MQEEPGSELWLGAYHKGPGEAFFGVGLSTNELIWRSLRQLADKGIDPYAIPDFTVDSLSTASGNTRAHVLWLAGSEGESIWLQALVADSMSGPTDWIVAARGSGVLHVWSADAQPDVVYESEDPLFRPLDNRYTIVNPSTSSEIISVGAFANRALPEPYEDLPVGDLLPFSSRGPYSRGIAEARPCCAWGADRSP